MAGLWNAAAMEGNASKKDDQTPDVHTGNIPYPVQTRNLDSDAIDNIGLSSEFIGGDFLIGKPLSAVFGNPRQEPDL
jgi:hypothetical protein